MVPSRVLVVGSMALRARTARHALARAAISTGVRAPEPGSGSTAGSVGPAVPPTVWGACRPRSSSLPARTACLDGLRLRRWGDPRCGRRHSTAGGPREAARRMASPAWNPRRDAPAALRSSHPADPRPVHGPGHGPQPTSRPTRPLGGRRAGGEARQAPGTDRPGSRDGRQAGREHAARAAAGPSVAAFLAERSAHARRRRLRGSARPPTPVVRVVRPPDARRAQQAG
jgi:hypothetical protein